MYFLSGGPDADLVTSRELCWPARIWRCSSSYYDLGISNLLPDDPSRIGPPAKSAGTPGEHQHILVPFPCISGIEEVIVGSGCRTCALFHFLTRGWLLSFVSQSRKGVWSCPEQFDLDVKWPQNLNARKAIKRHGRRESAEEDSEASHDVKPMPEADEPLRSGGRGTSWAKPGVLLALFCTVNFIVYCDRGGFTLPDEYREHDTLLRGFPLRFCVLQSFTITM